MRVCLGVGLGVHMQSACMVLCRGGGGAWDGMQQVHACRLDLDHELQILAWGVGLVLRISSVRQQAAISERMASWHSMVS